MIVTGVLFVIGNRQPKSREAKEPRANPSPALSTGPALRVDYIDGRGTEARLRFSTRGKPVRIHGVGELICEARYGTSSEVDLLTRVFPEVDARHPLECRISGVRDPLANETKSLPSVIESMGPHAVTSIVLEYETENKKQAERFFLHKNPDGNIVWQTNELIPATQDLRELNRRLRLLY
jgi:hypothetical protein